LKNVSWFLALLLGALLFYGLSSLPPRNSPILTDHVSSRYVERGEAETGIHSIWVAVLGDYRSFDLLAVSVLFTVTALGILAAGAGTAKTFPILPGLLWLGLGTALSLGLGLLPLKNDGNFLDFEILAFWTDPHRARSQGALLLMAGALLCLAGLLSLFVRRFRSPEGGK